MENPEVEELKAQIESLSQRIAVLEVSRTENAAESEGGVALDPSVPRKELVSVPNALHPFYVTCDGRETDPWLVYLPDGCCKDGDLTPDVIDPTPDATTHLADLQNDTKNGGIYAHLYLELDDDSDSDSSTEPEIVGFPLLSIDTTPTQAPSEENIKVINVKIATITDGAVAQNVSSALLIGGGVGSSFTANHAAFDLEVSTTTTGTKTGKIVRCNFVFDGENKSLSDFSVSGSGSVYLVAKQPAPSGGMGDLPWTFEISESEGEAAEGGRVVNYKLYDLNDFAVTCDYRTTFMELKSPHHVSKFTVSKYEEPQSSVVIEACLDDEAKVTASDGTASATLKASNETAETEVSDGSNSAKMEADGTTAKLTLSGTKTVTVDPNDLTQGNEAKFHKLIVKHADGSADDEYDVIADKDITINESAGDERLTGVELELNGDTNLRLKLTFTDKDGNTRDEYSTGITLKQVDVVSNVSWSSPTLSKSTKKLTVVEEESGGDEDVFTAVAHSSNS